MRQYPEGAYGIADYSVTFNDIEKMEEKRANFTQEQIAVHEATVKEWDRLYESIKALAEKYKDSESFKQSQIGKRWFQRANGLMKAAE